MCKKNLANIGTSGCEVTGGLMPLKWRLPGRREQSRRNEEEKKESRRRERESG